MGWYTDSDYPPHHIFEAQPIVVEVDGVTVSGRAFHSCAKDGRNDLWWQVKLDLDIFCEKKKQNKTSIICWRACLGLVGVGYNAMALWPTIHGHIWRVLLWKLISWGVLHDD